MYHYQPWSTTLDIDTTLEQSWALRTIIYKYEYEHNNHHYEPWLVVGQLGTWLGGSWLAAVVVVFVLLACCLSLVRGLIEIISLASCDQPSWQFGASSKKRNHPWNFSPDVSFHGTLVPFEQLDWISITEAPAFHMGVFLLFSVSTFQSTLVYPG